MNLSLPTYCKLLADDHALSGKLEWVDGSLFIVELPKLYHEGTVGAFKGDFRDACGGSANIATIESASSFHGSFRPSSVHSVLILRWY